MDARRHSAEHYTVYTDTEQVQTAESRLSPAPPQFDHPHHTTPPPCPVLIFNLSINTVPSVDSVNSLDTTPLSQ